MLSCIVTEILVRAVNIRLGNREYFIVGDSW